MRVHSPFVYSVMMNSTTHLEAGAAGDSDIFDDVLII